MEDSLYREIILEHWQDPQNSRVIENADFDENYDNPICGDKAHVTGKVENGTLIEVGIKVDGCAISVAGASMTSDYIINMPVEQIKNLDEEELLKQLELNSLTPARTKCALLGLATLKRAL